MSDADLALMRCHVRAYESVSEARAALSRYFAFFNARRPPATVDNSARSFDSLRESNAHSRGPNQVTSTKLYQVIVARLLRDQLDSARLRVDPIPGTLPAGMLISIVQFDAAKHANGRMHPAAKVPQEYDLTFQRQCRAVYD